MKLFHSNKTYEELLQDMQKDGYSQNYMKCVSREIRWLENHQGVYRFDSFEVACQIRVAQTSSPETQANRKTIYNLFHRYSQYGSLSEGKRNPLFRFGAYTQLNGEFKILLDNYEKESYRRGLKPGTVRASISACSGLLLSLQSSGFQSLEDVTEKAVLDSFSHKKLSSSTKVNIASVFEAQTGSYSDSARRILTYLPSLHRRRKNIQYLTEEETQAIRSVLSGNVGGLCLRSRAIGVVLYFTGMRSSDVAGLKFSDIDWEKEEIRIIRKKTGEELLLPLTTAVGNAIFDYATQERPDSADEHIFLCGAKPCRPISPGTVGNAAQKVYEAAAIRQNKGDRKGAHLFRHNLAASFAGSGIPRPIISSTPGHSDPDSLDHYLSADISHLRECAISIREFPVSEEVFRW